MAKEVRLAQWAEILSDRRDSGSSVRGYCQEQGINEKTYYYWQRRLRVAACNRLEEQHFPSFPQNESPVFAALPIANSRDNGGIVIRLNGAEIEIHSGAEPATIDTVLRIIWGCQATYHVPEDLCVVCGYTDLRKSIDGLTTLVQQSFRRPEQGRFQSAATENEARQITQQQFRQLTEGLSIDQPRAVHRAEGLSVV